MTGIGVAARMAAAFVDDVAAVQPFGHGHINDTFLAESVGGDVIVQRLNSAVFRDPDSLMANVLAVHHHLGGELVPVPVPARAGGWLAHDGDDAWRAWRRVSDARPARDQSEPIARAAGTLLGSFHARLAGLDAAIVVETLPGFHDLRRRLQALRAAIDADVCGRVEGARAEIDTCLDHIDLVERSEDLAASVPRRVAHYDAKLDNMLFRDGQGVCLVDLDTIMPGAWFWDVGDLVRTTATYAAEDDPGATIDTELYTAALDAYRRAAVPALEPGEVDALDHAGAVVTFEQAVRFLTDWLDGDRYYRTSRPLQNLDRARAQLGLLVTMPDTVPRS